MKKKLLHIGCGPLDIRHTTDGFKTGNWEEVRVDADANVSPDIIGSFVDLSMIESGSIDAIFSSHVLEHLFYIDVPIALSEARRVLKPKGFMVNTVPSLEFACKKIAEGKMQEILYMAGNISVTAYDLIFSHRDIVGRNEYQVHRCGFTAASLSTALKDAGFANAYSINADAALWSWAAIGYADNEFSDLVKEHFGYSKTYGM